MFNFSIIYYFKIKKVHFKWTKNCIFNKKIYTIYITKGIIVNDLGRLGNKTRKSMVREHQGRPSISVALKWNLDLKICWWIMIRGRSSSIMYTLYTCTCIRWTESETKRLKKTSVHWLWTVVIIDINDLFIGECSELSSHTLDNFSWSHA